MSDEPIYALSAKELISDSESEVILRSATDVSKFVVVMSKTFMEEFRDEETKEFSEAGKKWLKGLYRKTVFEGKQFRDRIPRSGGENSEERQADQICSDLPGWVDSGTEILITESRVFCYVVRGAEDATNVHSTLYQLADKSILPVVTYRLLQAVVSLLAAGFGLQKDWPPAKLGANVNLACKIPESKADKRNWAIHGHSGLNFVANYVYNYGKAKPGNANLKKYPSIDNLFMMAYRMDQANADNLKKLKNKPMYPTVEAIFRTTGMSMVEIEKVYSALEQGEKNWGAGFTSMAAGMTKGFVARMKKIEGGSSGKKDSKSDQAELNVDDFF